MNFQTGGPMFRNVLLIVMLVILSTTAHTPKPIIERVPIKKRLDEKEVVCLAKNIFYEAPQEQYLGKVAVATVTMNRVRHREFPKSICGVVFQRNSRGCQFSWTCGPRTPFDSATYKISYDIAVQVLTNNLQVNKLKNALYFHNTKVSPNWTFARPITQIGNHIFYEPKIS
jgi:spore germination cell wall hydrolase CwlJ-like protein